MTVEDPEGWGLRGLPPPIQNAKERKKRENERQEKV